LQGIELLFCKYTFLIVGERGLPSLEIKKIYLLVHGLWDISELIDVIEFYAWIDNVKPGFGKGGQGELQGILCNAGMRYQE
jgi:hypothetical protein